MKRLSRDYKNILKDIAKEIQSDLTSKIRDHRIIRIDDLQVEEMDTYGYSVKMFRLKKIGGVHLWIDLFPNIGRPVISICYWCRDIDRIRKIAESLSSNFQDDHSSTYIRDADGETMLEKPLAKKYFGRFLIEPYESKFFTYYFFDEIKTNGRIQKSFLNRISKKTEWLMKATVSALEIESNTNEDYPYENRKIVSQHIRRERSKKLADEVKLRDGFKCKVCDFDFQNTYGELGRGFAEAHHTTALSKLRGKVKNSKEDLITVCSNCHRMLHKMKGEENDYKELRKRVLKYKSFASK